jgi:hypothetical protein
MVFISDENAYQKVILGYIKRSLSNSSGHDEILKDIEMRVSELLNEKQISDKHVIGLKEVDEMIAVMGQPRTISLKTKCRKRNHAKTRAEELKNCIVIKKRMLGGCSWIRLLFWG